MPITDLEHVGNSAFQLGKELSSYSCSMIYYTVGSFLFSVAINMSNSF